METVCKINDLDAYTEWGVVFPETSISKLMNFAPLKQLITNKGASFNGIKVLPTARKVDSRDLTLVFYIYANNVAEMNEKLDAFESMLRAGVFTIWISDRPHEVYRLIYQNSNQFTQYNGRLAKFTLKVLEPNPTDRALTDD